MPGCLYGQPRRGRKNVHLPPVPTALLLSFIKISVPHRNKIPYGWTRALRDNEVSVSGTARWK